MIKRQKENGTDALLKQPDARICVPGSLTLVDTCAMPKARSRLGDRRIPPRNLFLFLMVFFMLPCPVRGWANAPGVETRTSKKQNASAEIERVSVSYVTLRNKIADNDTLEIFGGERGDLSAGRCTVSFSPIWGLDEIADSAPFYIPDEKISLIAREDSSLEQLYRDAASFSRLSSGAVVLYVHGYNIDFAKGCKRSAIFQRFLGGRDHLLLFSWPAENNVLKYTWDEADLAWSVPHMAGFVEELVDRVGDGTVNIVAHSLGARGVWRALVRLAYRQRSGPLVNNLVMIAPDIDSETFRQDLPYLKKTARRITIYVSENDKALRLSQEVHGRARLGQAGEYLAVFPGVETIDISMVGTRQVTGHLYHLFNPEVIADLTRLLHTEDAAATRPLLRSERKEGVRYWRLLPR